MAYPVIKFTDVERRNLRYYKTQIASIKRARKARQEHNDKLLDKQRQVDNAIIASRAKIARDDRIRKAVLKFAEAAKENGMKFPAPHFGQAKEAVFKLVVNDPTTYRSETVQIYTTYNGFQWD